MNSDPPTGMGLIEILFNLQNLLTNPASKRAVSYTEAIFQHAFHWIAHREEDRACRAVPIVASENTRCKG